MYLTVDEAEAEKIFYALMQQWDIDEEYMKQAFQYTLQNCYVDYEKLAMHLALPQTFILSYIQAIYMFRLGDRYFIQKIEHAHIKRDEQAFLKNSEMLFLSQPIEKVKAIYSWLVQYIKISERYYKKKIVAKKLASIVYVLNEKQVTSLSLKVATLVDVIYCFSLGKHYYRDVRKKIARVKLRWRKGKTVVTPYEMMLLTYMTVTVAFEHRQWHKVIQEAQYVLKNDRFMDAIVEMMVFYGELLPSLQPQTQLFIKSRQNMCEHLFDMLIKAYVQARKYMEVVRLIETYDLATCKQMQQFIVMPNEQTKVQLEAMVQQNIVSLLKQPYPSMKHVMQIWYSRYEQLEEVQQTSLYMTYILEALFAEQRYEAFETIMQLYTKYFLIKPHYEGLKEKIGRLVEEQEKLLST